MSEYGMSVYKITARESSDGLVDYVVGYCIIGKLGTTHPTTVTECTTVGQAIAAAVYDADGRHSRYRIEVDTNADA